MLSNLKSLLRPSSAANSTNTTDSTTSLSSTLLSVIDHFPFPTNPARVRKARHNNHPEYLPRPDASVRDVQYFLYTLLTSKRHDCAKKYPEWVLETCMGWNGDGQQLRNCTEEQLATLCPYQAIATGVDSPKHQPGAFVPIPARYMIGQVIVRFVAEKKSREKQIDGVQCRLGEERSRPVVSLGPYPGPEFRQDQSMLLSKTTSSASLRSSRAQPILSHVGSDGQAMSGFGPVMCKEPATAVNSGHVSDSATIPRHMPSRPYMLGAPNGGCCEQLSSSPVSSTTTIAPHDGTSSTFSQSTTRSNTPQQQPLQRRPSVNASREFPMDFGDMNIADTSTIHTKLPQRYAPRRPSGLRASSTTENNQNNRPCSTVPLRKSQTVRANDTGVSTILSKRPLGFLRRWGSLADSKLAIPEAVNEDGENSELSDDPQKKVRHDSGIENSPCRNASFSSSSPVLMKCTDSSLPELTPPVPDLSRSASLGPKSHHAWAASRLHNTLPVAKQMTGSVSFDLISNVPDLPMPMVSPPPPEACHPKGSVENKTTITNRERDDTIKASDLTAQFKAIEAEYFKLKTMRDEALACLPTPPCLPTLRKAQSDRVIYSSLDPMQGVHTGHKPWQNKPVAPQSPPKSDARPQSPEVFRPRQRTLIDVIEERERERRRDG